MKTMSVSRAIRLIERDHGGCDQNTCTLGVALRNGYELVAIDSWIGSGAASKEFDGVTLPFDFDDIRVQSDEMCADLEHFDCPTCNAVIWLPDECDYWCDSCGKQARGAV